MPASREDLMVRILALATAVQEESDEITTTVRNRGLLGNEKRPAQALLDGDERVAMSYPARRNGRGLAVMPPQIMAASPQLFYLPKEKRPQNSDPKNIGTEANEWRDAVLAKIWNDATLMSLLGPEGSLAYNGCETDLKSGSAMSGEIRLDFTMNYVLMP